ncbi:MAG: DNA-processing protein DprA [Syntrophothermus sp.]
MADSERVYWLALHRLAGVGSRRFKLLLAHFGSAKAAWRAGERALRTVPGLPKEAVDSLIDLRHRLEPEKEEASLAEMGIQYLILEDPGYPQLLKQISDPPPVLYVKGCLSPEDANALAVVGTRLASGAGRYLTEELVKPLACGGLTIVSGLARGIDTAAHTAALAAGGRTIGVLACGVDQIYPRENCALARRIVENGALVSEFPPGTLPLPGNFPARNRIISGLALGTLVVEAPEASGALITAGFAVDQGRDVFAVPGDPLRRASRGTNGLIKQGAKLVEDHNDIWEELKPLLQFCGAGGARRRGGDLPHHQTQLPLGMEDRQMAGDAAQILRLLTEGPLHVDLLAQNSGLAISRVNAALIYLQLAGKVQELDGNIFVQTP